MASRSDKQYYQNYIGAADCACRAAEYLLECMTNYDPARLDAMLERMHEFEHSGDMKKHEMSLALAKAFVTPIDREDMAEISQKIDEVTDTIEGVLQRFYIHHIREMAPESLEFARKLSGCCTLMKNMMTELENFKRPERIREMIIGINHAEENCDHLYLSLIAGLRDRYETVLEIISWREVYDFMEDCADACEHVADSVETIVMKNT